MVSKKMFVVRLGVILMIFKSFCPSLVTAKGLSSSFTVRKNSVILSTAAVLKSEETEDLMSCAMICGREPLCKFTNFDEKRNTCTLVRETAADSTGKQWTEQDNSIGLEKVGYNLLKGTLKELAVSNCKELLKINPALTSGVYWIDPDGGSHNNAFKAYCEQFTNGGGWTLVWSYHFTDYLNFQSKQNAITPRPSWSVNQNDVRVSTTPPLSESQYDAVEFSLWKKIGSDVLIKSNINNWITCKPGTGSLVDWIAGSVTCHSVKSVNSKCSVVPNRLKMWKYGPAFAASNAFYYFEGCRADNWPTHDPCGENKPNQLTGVENPHGNIFVR